MATFHFSVFKNKKYLVELFCYILIKYLKSGHFVFFFSFF